MVVMSTEEEISESSKGAEEGAIVPMAKQFSKKGGSVLLQRKHNLSVTFLRNSQGVMLKLFQAPEITRNFGAFPPSRSQFKLRLEEVAESTSNNPSKKDSVKMIGWNNSETTSHRSQISKTLREVVKRAVMEFRLSSSASIVDETGNLNGVVEAVPVSFRPPDSVNMDMRKRVTTLLVGESLVSFKLPRNSHFDQKHLDKLVEEERRANAGNGGNVNINDAPKYSLVERLQGWKMERRQRVNGRFDMYYHHLESRRTFRSITEVVNFFLFEVYPDKPQKSATKSKLGEDDLISGKKSERRERRGTPLLKRKIDESEKSRDKMHPIYDLNGEDQKASYDHHHHIPIYDLDGEDQKADDHHKPTYDNVDGDDHSPIHDLGDDQNYEEAYDHKETVEKFLAEAYNNLINGPHDQTFTSFSIDINEEINEEEEEDDDDGNFNPNKQTVEELLAEAYNNLLNYSHNEAKLQKAKDKRSSRSIEKPRRKKAKTFTPASFPSFPNAPINLNSIPTELKEEKKITDTVVEPSMKVEEKASVIANVKHKRFNIKEVNGNVVFSDVDCEPNYGLAAAGGGGGGSSAIEVAKSVAFSHMDECDLINHIPESSDMFDLAMFLANNRGSGGF